LIVDFLRGELRLPAKSRDTTHKDCKEVTP